MRGVIELLDRERNCIGRIQTTWPDPFPTEGRFFFVEDVTNPDAVAVFSDVDAPVLVCDALGQLIGRFENNWYGKPPFGIKSPFTDEQIEEARKSSNSGITLAEFWEKVKRGEWG
jgi:hypothetical protein